MTSTGKLFFDSAKGSRLRRSKSVKIIPGIEGDSLFKITFQGLHNIVIIDQIEKL